MIERGYLGWIGNTSDTVPFAMPHCGGTKIPRNFGQTQIVNAIVNWKKINLNRRWMMELLSKKEETKITKEFMNRWWQEAKELDLNIICRKAEKNLEEIKGREKGYATD